MEPILPKRRVRDQVPTLLRSSNCTSAIPNKSETSDASEYNLSSASHNKEEKCTDISFTSAVEQVEMEKPSIMEHSEVHETTDKNADLGSPEVKDKEQLTS